MAECAVLTGGGGGVDCDNASARREDILSGKTAGIASSDEVVVGSMHNLSAETPVKDVSRNSVVVCGSVTLDKQSDNVERLSIINTGTDGFIRHNTRIGVSMDTVRTALGITQDKVIAGMVVGGITGTASNDTDARPEHITAPHTAIVRGEKVRGTNPDNGAVYPSALSAGASYTIPRGHHNGNGRVVARDLASQTQANAGAGDILLGKSAWVNGGKINGTMPSIAAQESAKSVSVSGDYVYLRMSNGAHISNANSGFPEIYINKNVLYQKMGSRVSFNGANFDGGLLTGFANGLLRGEHFAEINLNEYNTELSASIDRTNDSGESGGGEPFTACWAFNPSININPYKNVEVTISYSFSNISILPNGDGFNMIAGLISTNTGNRGERWFDKCTVDGNIYGTNPSGALTSTIDCSSLTGEYFLAVFLYGSRVRRRRTDHGLGYEHVKLEKIVFNV